jgi:hypothetical protein
MSSRAVYSRIAVFALAVAALLVFSRMTTEAFAALSFGATIMLLGMAVYYRLAAVVGMLVMTTSVACCASIDTLTEVSMVFTSLLGLVLPSALLAWLAVTTDTGAAFRLPRMERPFALAGLYVLLCVFSVPLVLAITGLAYPSVVSRLEGLAEVSIVLLVVAIGAVALSLEEPDRARAGRR